MYFHDIRNKMYHEGDGVTVTEKNLADYSSFAEDLLEELLGVDIKPEAVPEEEKTPQPLPKEILAGAQRQRYINDVSSEISKLETSIASAIGFLKPTWGSPGKLFSEMMIGRVAGQSRPSPLKIRHTQMSVPSLLREWKNRIFL